MASLKSDTQSRNGSIPHRIHLIGAGGVHLSAIGQILLARGHIVTGSDLARSEYTDRLQTAGATIYEGHAPSNLGRAELVVATVAVAKDNTELQAAHERGIDVLLRAEMVQRLLAGRHTLAIAGSHGKTTTTALLAQMAIHGGLDPLVLLGGDSPDLEGNAREGSGEHAIIEADEYAEAFLEYEPHIALISNVETDHLDFYGNEERLHAAFLAFADRVQDSGTLIVGADSPVAAAIGEVCRANGARVERFGLSSDAEWSTTQLRPNDEGGLEATISLEGVKLGQLSLRVPGRHNVANALGALAVAMRAGVDFKRASQAAWLFNGTRRRFESLGEARGVELIDDYAHHPTEIRATLAAARQRYPGHRLVGCFQPHTYSRSQYLLNSFRDCFESLDALFVVPTYAARETPSQGLDAEGLAAEIESPVPQYLSSLSAAVEAIGDELLEGDVFLTLGAGNINTLQPLLRSHLEKKL